MTVLEQPKMVLLVQAGALLVLVLLLQGSHVADAVVVEEHEFDVVLPKRRPCNQVCPYIYEPVCVAGCKTPLTTFSNRCLAGIYACENYETLLVVHKGPCKCKRRHPFFEKDD